MTYRLFKLYSQNYESRLVRSEITAPNISGYQNLKWVPNFGEYSSNIQFSLKRRGTLWYIDVPRVLSSGSRVQGVVVSISNDTTSPKQKKPLNPEPEVLNRKSLNPCNPQRPFGFHMLFHVICRYWDDRVYLDPPM